MKGEIFLFFWGKVVVCSPLISLILKSAKYCSKQNEFQ